MLDTINCEIKADQIAEALVCWNKRGLVTNKTKEKK